MMKKMVCFITQVLCFLDCFFDASDVCVYMIYNREVYVKQHSFTLMHFKIGFSWEHREEGGRPHISFSSSFSLFGSSKLGQGFNANWPREENS